MTTAAAYWALFRNGVGVMVKSGATRFIGHAVLALLGASWRVGKRPDWWGSSPVTHSPTRLGPPVWQR